MLHTLQQLPEKIPCGIFTCPAVRLDAVKEFSSIGKLHDQEQSAFAVLRQLQHCFQANNIGVRADLAHVANFAEDAISLA